MGFVTQTSALVSLRIFRSKQDMQAICVAITEQMWPAFRLIGANPETELSQQSRQRRSAMSALPMTSSVSRLCWTTFPPPSAWRSVVSVIQNPVFWLRNNKIASIEMFIGRTADSCDVCGGSVFNLFSLFYPFYVTLNGSWCILLSGVVCF